MVLAWASMDLQDTPSTLHLYSVYVTNASTQESVQGEVWEGCVVHLSQSLTFGNNRLDFLNFFGEIFLTLKKWLSWESTYFSCMYLTLYCNELVSRSERHILQDMNVIVKEDA